ncbi:MAG: hypothetical protein E6R03_15000 [Hyphomicrobiaceae bacterium]|nr:MAG: hypothetical protein E6R03_15000 [Hyphomicrobiaceae bacterium]
MTNPHVAVLVLNRNMREMTENLIDTIRKTSTPDHTIFALDAASDKEQQARNGDVSIFLTENKRWAWSFAYAMGAVIDHTDPDNPVFEHGVDLHTKYELVATTSPTTPKGQLWFNEGTAPFTHFWLLCNDTQLDPRVDTLNLLLQCMPEDACQIHPYQTTHPNGSPQGRHHLAAAAAQYVNDKGIPGPNPRVFHNVAFVEFVCPLITRSFYDACIERFECSPVGPHFPYGWGVDYEMAYFGHSLGLKSYICDGVGITHHPGTTHENHEKTKVEDNNRMRILARNSMLDVLEARYGRNWGDIFAKAAVDAGVDPKAFLEWSQHDRALASGGLRVS